jgi:hypothetical protein
VRQYCICFRAGLLCEGCDCVECLNDGKHEEERLAAIEHIKTSDPLAFVEKIRPDGTEVSSVLERERLEKIHVRGCRCKNSKCLKKYCECFEHGVSCTSRCDCRDCLNGKPSGGEGTGKKSKAGSAAVVAQQARPAGNGKTRVAPAPPSEDAKATGAAPEAPLGWVGRGTGKDKGASPSKWMGAPQTPHRDQLDGALLHVPPSPGDPAHASAALDFSRGVPASCSPLSALSSACKGPGLRSPLRSPARRMHALSSPGVEVDFLSDSVM